MNVVINLVEIEDGKNFSKYLLKINDIVILDKIIRQIYTQAVDNIIILVNNTITSQVEEAIELFEYKEKVSIKTLHDANEKKIAKQLQFDNIEHAYKNFYSPDFSNYFAESIDLSKDIVVLDGTKLYKKNIFDFSKCNYDTYVKFKSKDSSNETNYILYITNKVTNKPSNLKSIQVVDFGANFIDMRNIETLINSSSAFCQDKKLMFEYIVCLFESLEYEYALNQILNFASFNGYWALFYLELLEGFGLEYEFVSFYKHNRKLIRDWKFTKTQTIMYQNMLNILEVVDREQQLVNEDVKEYLIDRNVDFDYIISSINSSKTKQINTSFLSRKLIQLDQLTNKQAYYLIDQFDSLNMSAHIKMKNIIDICDYFFTNSKINQLDHKLMNRMFKYLFNNKFISESGIESKIQEYTKKLAIYPRIALSNPQFQTKQSESPRIAVCISGVAKYNFEKNLERLDNMLSQNLEVDYFVQMWDKFEYFPALSEHGLTPDFNWAGYYLSRLNNIQPHFIKRQVNFEALFPQTSKLLYTKDYRDLSITDYTDQLGSKIVSIKKYKLEGFISKFSFSNTKFKKLNNKIIKYFERSIVQELLDAHICETGKSYDYVFNIDINTALKSPIHIEDLKSLSDKQVKLLVDQNERQFGVSYSVAKYETAKYINNIWDVCIKSQNASPYLVNDMPVIDPNQDPMILHMLHGKLDINSNVDQLGAPYINKKIVLPSIKEAVASDLLSYDGDSEPFNKYFSEVERIFACVYDDNKNYQVIKKVKLKECNITDTGVVVELSIIGHGLKQIHASKLHLHGKSKMNFDSTHAHPRVYKKSFKVLKHDDEEIVVRRVITDRELFTGKAWTYTVQLHDMSLNHYKIESEPSRTQYELTKYGMKYIKLDTDFTIGIDTKSYSLKEL